MNDLPKILTNAQMQNLIDSNLFSVAYDPDLDGYAATPNYRYCRPETPRYIAAYENPANWYREDDL